MRGGAEKPLRDEHLSWSEASRGVDPHLTPTLVERGLNLGVENYSAKTESLLSYNMALEVVTSVFFHYFRK